MQRTAIRDWLIHCADPLGPRTRPPRRPLAASLAHEFVHRAEYHGVLAALFQNFAPFAEASGGGDQADFTEARSEARQHHRLQRAFALMLEAQADAVMADANDIPATIIKGPAFARQIYPEPWYRPFTDIDMLVARRGLAPLEAVLAARGFRPDDVQDPTGEVRSWVHDEFRPTLFELHLNLVTSNQKWHCSLCYDDIADGPQRPAALLITAIIHGGATHRFLRMQHLVDVCQAARQVTAAKEEAAFAALAKKANAQTLAGASLLLVGRIMTEPMCLELATLLGKSHLARIAGRSLGKTAVTAAEDEFGATARMQRQMFRKLIGLGDPIIDPPELGQT